MTPLFNGIDLASDAAFLLWVAYIMLRFGLALSVFAAARIVWRWVGKARRRRRIGRRVDRLVKMIKGEYR